ncbi:MAG: ethylbenzene dehydrogenase-related protein [Candidatus Sedimenticola sp. (ex Thyasira tokunagai)]
MGRFVTTTLFLLGFLSSAVEAETVKVAPLSQAPVVDGLGDDWKEVPEITIPLRPISADTAVEAKKVMLKAGYFADRVYFHLRWPDSEENRVHKPYVWDKQKKRYVRGPQREDRFSMQFVMEGVYTSDWLSANHFKADMWHWKSARTAPLNIAHDKMTIVSGKPLIRAARLKRPDGAITYVLRPSDAGVQPYTTKRYRNLEQQVMPKYQLNPEVSGSVADVKAKGRWFNGFWHLELSRKLDTGNEDDAIFKIGESLPGGIAIFDASETDDHAISGTLNFQF